MKENNLNEHPQYHKIVCIWLLFLNTVIDIFNFVKVILTYTDS